jgi:hypothetical protein
LLLDIPAMCLSKKPALFFVLIILVSLSEAQGQPGKFSTYRPPLPGSIFSLEPDSIPPACTPPRLPAALPVEIHPSPAADDTTPPSPPLNVSVVRESIHSLFGRWEAAEDPESGISAYVYAIGTGPGEGDIRWWQSTGLALSSYGTSMRSLGLEEGEQLYYSVYAVNGAGLASETISVGPVAFTYDPLGEPASEMTVDYAGPWSAGELSDLEWFLARMLPIIEEIYGPPSHSYTVTLVNDSSYVNVAIFFPGANEIHMNRLYPQLLTHELIHAFRDNVILSSDDLWNFNPTLSGFEESFAQGISYVCMNRYIEMYPADPVVPPNTLYGSFYEWDYDYNNNDVLTTTDFWSDAGGTGMFWLRYEMGAAAVLKILKDCSGFARDFNRDYYTSLNADHDLTPSRGLVREIVSRVAPHIEGRESNQWIDGQRIFDCTVRSGRKIFTRTQHYPGWEEYLIFQNIYYYETFPNGSEWAYWDSLSGEWVFHNLNGSTGYGTLRDATGDIVWEQDLLIEPTQNPPEYYGFGNEILHLSTDDDTSPWPGGDPNDFILGLTDFGAYRLHLSFGADSTEVVRVMGDPLRSTSGIFGAVLHSAGGEISLNHEAYPEEPPIPLVNGAFHGERAWASIFNPNTGYMDSSPGRVFVVYRDADGNTFRDQRSVDVGSWSGNQLFLFDTLTMTPIQPPEQVALVSPADAEIVHTDSVQFVWRQAAPEITRYWFEIATDSLMGEASVDSTLMAPDTTTVRGSLIENQIYWWRVRAENLAGWGEFSAARRFGIGTTGIDTPAAGNIAFHLSQNYPNPFNGPTTIRFDVPDTSRVTLKVYDVHGREVSVLISGEKVPGSYEVAWEPHGMGSGVYFYRLQIAGRNGTSRSRFVQTRKFTFIR